MTFEELERKYHELKGKHTAGLLSDEEFLAEVDKLTLQDSEGRWWMIGATTGKWYLSQEGEWVEAEPPVERVCPQCGAPMEEGAILCGSCGYSLVEKPAPPPYVSPPSARPKPTVTTAPPVAKRPHPRLLIGVIGVFFLCCLSGAVLGAYDYLSPTKPLSTRLMGLLGRPTSGLRPAAIPTTRPTARATPPPTYPPMGTPTLTPTYPPTVTPTLTPTCTPTVTLTPDEIMSRSAEKMSEVTSAHITFEQQVFEEFTRTGWGDVMLPDRAQCERADDGEEPVEFIIIGSTGYWRDDSAPGGWNLGPIREFTSNPAKWVPLSQYYTSPVRLTDDTINGIDCYHLQFTVNLDPAKSGVSGGGTGEAWIGKMDYPLVKAIYELQYQSFRDSGSMKLTLELSQLNKPVSIVPPSWPTPTATSTPETDAEYLRILAVDVPEQVNAGELFVVTIRYAWSFCDKGTVGIRAEGGGGYRGQPGSPTEVTGEGEFTHSLPVLAPDTSGPHTFGVEAYGYSVTSPNLIDRWEVAVSVIAPGGQAELDAETALAILPSADELGIDQLAFMKTVMADRGEGYGDLTDYRVFDSGRSKIVGLIAFASADDAGRFTAQLFSDYQGMGDTPAWIDLGDEAFARQREVLVRVERHILWALGEVSLGQLRPSVQRLQAFVESTS